MKEQTQTIIVHIVHSVLMGLFLCIPAIIIAHAVMHIIE
jgi:hypothetical protein